jgi:hypothetical protein
MKMQKKSFEEAYELVDQQRKLHMNTGFKKQLKAYEATLQIEAKTT